MTDNNTASAPSLTTKVKSFLSEYWPFAALVGAVAVIAIGTAIAATPAQSADFNKVKLTEARVKNNPGGVVDDFKELRDRFIKDGTKVVIEGYCASACTLFLSVPNVCAMPGAKFHFHAPFFSGGDSLVIWSDEGTQEMLKEYSPAIRAWIEQHGGLGKDLITLEGDEMKALVPQCEVPAAVPATS